MKKERERMGKEKGEKKNASSERREIGGGVRSDYTGAAGGGGWRGIVRATRTAHGGRVYRGEGASRAQRERGY